MTAEAVGPTPSQADIGSQGKPERSLLAVCGAYVVIGSVFIGLTGNSTAK